MSDLTVLPFAEELLTCLCAELALVSAPPQQCCLRTGETVFPAISLTEDECCSGLAWVRISSIFVSEANFPEPDTEPRGGCPPSWLGVQLEMGVARCAPTGSLSSNPTCDEWTILSERVLEDAGAMRRAFCCLNIDNSAKLLGAWTPLPTEGRCAGGTVIVTIQVPNCDEC
jgi:hypothetical protein